MLMRKARLTMRQMQTGTERNSVHLDSLIQQLQTNKQTKNALLSFVGKLDVKFEVAARWLNWIN